MQQAVNTNSWYGSAFDFIQGATDTVSHLASQYLGVREQLDKVEASGAAQAALNGAVERPTNVGAVPVGVKVGQATGENKLNGSSGFAIDQNTLLMIAGAAALVFLLKK